MLALVLPARLVVHVRHRTLPSPKDEDFSLFMRAYWPKIAALDGSWTPPAVQRVG